MGCGEVIEGDAPPAGHPGADQVGRGGGLRIGARPGLRRLPYRSDVVRLGVVPTARVTGLAVHQSGGVALPAQLGLDNPGLLPEVAAARRACPWSRGFPNRRRSIAAERLPTISSVRRPQ